eukprot:TCONS_00065421-protein
MAFNTTLLLLVFLFLSVNCYHKECHPRCGAIPWHVAGMCDGLTGRCICFYGWTGPNSKFRIGTRNKIEADYCSEACHYTHDYRNTQCVYRGTGPTEAYKECQPLCGHIIFRHAGECLKDKYGKETGKCLCWWGWTGPGAQYRSDGRIEADYCVLPCYYTVGFSNPVCAQGMNEYV